MSRIPLRFWVLGAVLGLLNVGGLCWIRAELIAGQRQVRVIAALPGGDADMADRLTLVFDQACAGTRLVNQPLARAPFILTPAAAGQWVWAAPERLEFRLDKPLPPGRSFVLAAAADAEGVLRHRLAGKTEFHFQTRALELQGWEFVGFDQTHATFALCFNQPVHPADLLRSLRAADPDTRRTLDTTVLTAEPAERLIIRLQRPWRDDVELELGQQLTGHEAERPLVNPGIRRLRIVRQFALLSADVRCNSLEPDIDVALRFSRQLDLTQSVPAVSTSPPVEGLRTRVTGDWLMLTGRFACKTRYTTSIPATLLSKTGETLGETQTTSFEIPDRQPDVSFAASNGILSPAGNAAVEVSLVNLSSLRLRAARLHANNLVAALHSPRELEHTHRVLPEKIVPLNVPRNTPTKMLLDLRGLIDQPCGIFHVEAGATSCEWTSDAVVVTLTDLGLTAKSYRGGVLVWVTSLRAAHPVAGAEVTALSQNNQVLARGTTDAEGLVRLDVPEKHPDGPVWLITAERDGDLSFLQPERRPWLLDDVDQSGRAAPTTYDVLLYTERGVYRPGDTVHLTGIVRDAAGGVPPVFPLALRVRRPDGRKVAELPVTMEATDQGVFHCDYATREDGQLGRYCFAASLPGAEEVLGQTQALVEEFVPVRLAVEAHATQPRFGPGETPRLAVQARYLFDQPAAGLPLSIAGEFRRVAYQSARYAAFKFGAGAHKETWKLPAIKDELDADGRAELELALPQGTSGGIWTADVAASVTNPGGRSTVANAAVVVDTADRHIGLRLPGGNVSAPDGAAQVEWVFVDGADAEVTGALEFELVRVEYESALEIVNERPVWKSVERLVPVWKQQVTADADGPAQLHLDIRDPGQYRILATHADSNSTSAIEFYIAADPAETESLALNRPERLEIVLDRDAYVPGSVADVLIRSPISGTLLLTLESDRVLDHRLISVSANTARVELPVPITLRGGAFVAATLVRAIDPAQEKWLPHRAVGLARLLTDHQAEVLPVSIVAPSGARPGSTVTVRVQTVVWRPTSAPTTEPTSQPVTSPESQPATAPTTQAAGVASMPIAQTRPAVTSAPAAVHLWAVDEGILQTTAYALPDPREYFLGKRTLEVTSADVFGDLLPDYRRPADMAHIGGDRGEEEQLRRSPVPARRQAPAVIWRTSAPVGRDGALTATLDLPKITGEIRLMAVAVAADQYGAAQRSITLTTPLVVEASWPRFVAPGDRFRVPVKLFNTSRAPLTTTLDFAITGPVQAELPPDQRQIVLKPGEPQTVWLDATTTGIGQVDALCTARATGADGESLVETSSAAFPVRPIAPLQSETAFLRIEAGQETLLDPPGHYLPGTGRATLTISASPQVELLPALEQLLDYPYGCIEQTTSRLYALLHTPELLAARNEGAGRVELVRDMVNAGLLRLWSMQTRDGGFSYWPGGQYSDLWPSAYVGELLVAAQRAGYKLQPQFVNELVKYLKARLNDSERHPSGGPSEKTDNIRALICRVLAGLGQPQEGWQARLSERLDLLDMGGRAHLAAAWLETGRRDRAWAALPPDTMELTVTGSTGGRITSQVEQEANLLAVLLEPDPAHAWIPVLVRRLEAARADGCWSNTLENATALAALARYQLIGMQPGTFSGQVFLGEQSPETFDSARPTTLRVPLIGQPVRLTSTGSGNIFVTVQTRGLSADGDLPPVDRQVRVRRAWTDGTGQPLDPAALHVGDLVYVQITLEALNLQKAGSIDNVAIVDALPGGLEAENPELATAVQQGTDATDDDSPERVEFRDDRVVIFSSAGTQPRRFNYVLRAVAVGTFVVPPIEATCMYDPGAVSRDGGGLLEVQQ